MRALLDFAMLLIQVWTWALTISVIRTGHHALRRGDAGPMLRGFLAFLYAFLLMVSWYLLGRLEAAFDVFPGFDLRRWSLDFGPLAWLPIPVALHVFKRRLSR